MQFAEVVDKKITKPVSKIFIGIILLGFILLTIVWGPSLIGHFSVKAEPVVMSIERESVDMNALKSTRQPIETHESEAMPTRDVSTKASTPLRLDRETISWTVGIIQSSLLILLGIKKVFGKGA